jgi:hypothetical protein
METYGGVHVILISVLVAGEWLASRSDRFTPEETAAPGTHWIGGWLKRPKELSQQSDGRTEEDHENFLLIY